MMKDGEISPSVREKFLACSYTTHLSEMNHVLSIPLTDVAQIVRGWKDEMSYHSLSNPSPDWAGADIKTAQVMLADGWTTDRPTITIPSFSGEKVTQTMTMDVQGSYPDVSLFLSGDPENMVSFTEESMKANGYCHMKIDLGSSSSFTASDLYERGQQVLSFVDALEASGTRVKLTAISCTYEEEGYVCTQQIEIVIKDYQDPSDESLICFVFGHPAMPRRILFAVADVMHANGVPMLLASAQDSSRNYPCERDISPDKGDIHIPAFKASGTRRKPNVKFGNSQLRAHLQAYIDERAAS
jgi:hypothetical protein